LFPKIGFDLAFRYRNPALILTDAFVGQLKEDIEFPKLSPPTYDVSWAVTGASGREPHIINSLELDHQKHRAHLSKIFQKYKIAEEKEVLYEEYLTEDAETVIVAFGIVSRIARGAVNKLRKAGIKVGLFRPITLWPFPAIALRKLAVQGKQFLDVELNNGQMYQDLKLAVGDGTRVDFLGYCGGVVPTEVEIVKKIQKSEVIVA
jgi:pyruvate/2-oxoacid:ferredoxin oxidoreductase alpha subunit